MFQQATPVVRNLLIINIIFYVVTHFLAPELRPMLAGYYPSAPQFQPWQVVTHMFMHASLGTFSSTCLPCSCLAPSWSACGVRSGS